MSKKSFKKSFKNQKKKIKRVITKIIKFLEKIKNRRRLEVQDLQLQEIKKIYKIEKNIKIKISTFLFDPSSGEALEELRDNVFPRVTIRRIKKSPFRLMNFIQKKKRLLQTYAIKTWFSGRRKIFSFKIDWLKKNRRFLKKSHSWKKEFLENFLIRIYKEIELEKKDFGKKSYFFANEIMEAEADYLRLINLQKYYEDKITNKNRKTNQYFYNIPDPFYHYYIKRDSNKPKTKRMKEREQERLEKIMKEMREKANDPRNIKRIITTGLDLA